MARLGCKVGFIGKIAWDREGKFLLKNLKKEKVDVSEVKIVKYGTSGVVLGFVDKNGARALYVNPGVNDTIKMNEIDKNYVKRTKFLHLSSFVGVESFKTQVDVLKKLPENVKVSFDPGALYARLGLSHLEQIIERTFVLMPNVRELALLLGVRLNSDYRENANLLLNRGVKIVAVKLGKRGCYVTSRNENHLIDAFNVKVRDTTGAGDAFCAGFLYGLIKGLSLDECGRIGNFVASRSIMEIGARAGLPTLANLSEAESMLTN